MASEIYITVGVEWRDIEPEGSKCIACGDACYLREVAIFVLIGSIYESDSGFRLCGSCADAATDERGE